MPAILPGVYLLLTSTVNTIDDLWAYDAKRILQLILLFLLFITCALHKPLREKFESLLNKTPIWIRFGVLAFFTLGFISSIENAQSWMHWLSSLSEVVLLLLLVLATLVVASGRQLNGSTFDNISVGFLMLTALAVGLQEILGLFAAKFAQLDFNYELALLHFSHPRFYNQLQSWLVPVLAALPILTNNRKNVYFLTVFVIGLQWYILLMTGARGAVISITAATFVCVVFFPNVRLYFIKIQLFALLIGALIFGLAATSFESNRMNLPSESKFLEQSVSRPLLHTTGRTHMWQLAGSDAIKNPILGIGPNNYSCSTSHWFGHPHNFPMQLLSEWGFIATGFIATIFIFLYFKSIKYIGGESRARNTEIKIPALLSISVSAAVVHSFVSGIFVTPASQVAGVLICGMLIGNFGNKQKFVKSFTSSLTIWFAALLSLGLTVFGLHVLKTMEYRAEAVGAKVIAPKIWQDSKACRAFLPEKNVNN